METEHKPLSLFGEKFNEEPWKREWVGMPEFVQEDLMAWRTIYVHFEDQDDLDAFSELVGQNITDLTKFLWFPKVESIKSSKYRYKNEQ